MTAEKIAPGEEEGAEGSKTPLHPAEQTLRGLSNRGSVLPAAPIQNGLNEQHQSSGCPFKSLRIWFRRSAHQAASLAARLSRSQPSRARQLDINQVLFTKLRSALAANSMMAGHTSTGMRPALFHLPTRTGDTPGIPSETTLFPPRRSMRVPWSTIENISSRYQTIENISIRFLSLLWVTRSAA